MSLSNRGQLARHTHAVVIHDVKARCCESTAHRRYVPLCTCGWKDREHVERTDAVSAATGHRIAVLEAHAGIKFSVEHAPRA